MTDAQRRSLERVGYDTSGATNRSASFLIEDESAKEATSKERDLVMASMREARQKYPWVKELEFSLVKQEKDEFTRLIASHEDAAGNFIHVAEGAKVSFPAQSCFLLKTQRHEQSSIISSSLNRVHSSTLSPVVRPPPTGPPAAT